MIIYKCDVCKKPIEDIESGFHWQIIKWHGLDRNKSLYGGEEKCLIHLCSEECENRLKEKMVQFLKEVTE